MDPRSSLLPTVLCLVMITAGFSCLLPADQPWKRLVLDDDTVGDDDDTTPVGDDDTTPVGDDDTTPVGDDDDDTSGTPCAGGGEPLQQGCGNFSWEGCCEGDDLYWCESDWVCHMDCTELESQYCGWDSEQGFYNCGTDGNPAPGNNPPIDC